VVQSHEESHFGLCSGPGSDAVQVYSHNHDRIKRKVAILAHLTWRDIAETLSIDDIFAVALQAIGSVLIDKAA
jgi:hypothetical protein